MIRYKHHLVCTHVIASDEPESGSLYCPRCGLWNAIERSEEWDDEDV